MIFEQWATARVPVLVRTAVALCGDVGLAEDLVQDVLIKVHARWDHISALEAREAYVRRMLVNELTSWRRKWSRIQPVADVPVGAVVSARDSAQDTVLADRDVLRAELRRLPRRQQVVLALRYYADLPDGEIAEALGCRETTVRSLAHRALKALRAEPALLDHYSPPATDVTRPVAPPARPIRSAPAECGAQKGTL